MQLEVGPLPADALEASAEFHSRVLPRVRAALVSGPSHLTLVFPPAAHEHCAWRKAAVQTLATASTPVRINAVAGSDPASIAAAETYVAAAPGLTGHYLMLDGAGAGKVV